MTASVTPVRKLHPDAVASPAYWDRRKWAWVFSARHGNVAVTIALHSATDAASAAVARARWLA